MTRRFYGKGLPGVDLKSLSGKFIVIEGRDSSGCSTQAALLKDSLERMGYPVAQIGIGKSEFMGIELQEALKTNILCPITLSLLHTTEIIDQVENKLLHSLRAGFIVIADRYIHTTIARHRVRGGDERWIKAVFGAAIVPDAIFYLDARPEVLAARSFAKKGTLDYWESGRDMRSSDDIYESFLDYQKKLGVVFRSLAREYKMETINSERTPESVNSEIVSKIAKILPLKTRLKSGKKSQPEKMKRSQQQKKSGIARKAARSR